MSPDTSRWRSSSSYDYVDHLIAPDAGWERLRRNEDYQRDCAELTSALEQSPPLIERAGPAMRVAIPCRQQLARARCMLQAVDGHRAGASQPEIAKVIFRLKPPLA